MTYEPTIGMEVHIQPKTKTKMFCRCPNKFEIAGPNKNICEVCTGQPGTLPAVNQKAVEAIIKAGLALNCTINKKVHWDRKHYSYPDLPKGYQITQNEDPFCVKGFLEFEYEDEMGKQQTTKIAINRLHLEEDAGKDLHPSGVSYSLVDYNRAGTPLIELVTEPVIKNKEQAVAFCRNLQRIFRYIKVSQADMEKGQMRCEANISLSKNGKLGTKVEIKNIGSFKGVFQGIAYEIERQTKLLDAGKQVKQETRGWDAKKQITIFQRSKEEAQDYRYFPEPDIPPVNVTEGLLQKIKNSIPELPVQKERRFKKDFGLSSKTAHLFASNLSMAYYFEKVVSEIENWVKDASEKKELAELIKLASNYLATELFRMLKEKKQKFAELKITPENFAELILIVHKGEINSSAAQVVIQTMFEKGGDPSQIIEDKNLKVEKDTGVLEQAVNNVMQKNPSAVTDFKAGKQQALQFLVGQVMAETKGKADPKIVIDMLKEKL
ncbi:MAG: Asp-tRNA(Asn)/Glu-tRNA(Gln) amidotransferase subunit GatB [Patescibacteria group bacterium]|nr:Asp-tRNA(Asn)/Glu-tRNA(Gln) amidotransferase subunit GatB [Patescibacteria group bacterium]